MSNRVMQLKVDLPYLPKGTKYLFEDQSGWVYWYDKSQKKFVDVPLRTGLAGYLWLLSTDRKYMRRIKSNE